MSPPEHESHDVTTPLVLPPNVLAPGWKVLVMTDEDEVMMVFEGVAPGKASAR